MGPPSKTAAPPLNLSRRENQLDDAPLLRQARRADATRDRGEEQRIDKKTPARSSPVTRRGWQKTLRTAGTTDGTALTDAHSGRGRPRRRLTRSRRGPLRPRDSGEGQDRLHAWCAETGLDPKASHFTMRGTANCGLAVILTSPMGQNGCITLSGWLGMGHCRRSRRIRQELI